MKNCPQYWELLFACWHAGLAAVPMNAKLHAKEFEYIVENCGAKACFFRSRRNLQDLKGEPRCRRPSRGPDDLAWLFYTSGTTGVPKGAMLTHRNLLFADAGLLRRHRQARRRSDAILHAAPLSHGSGLYGLPHFAAGAVNVIPESGGFDAAEIFELMERWPNASFFAAPTMIVRLLASPAARTPRKLKTIIYGGAPMYVADCLRAIELFGPRLYQLYGQGESPMTITGLAAGIPREQRQTGDLRLRAHRRRSEGLRRGRSELPAGETGEIVTRSDCVMAGLLENPEATAKALRGGWLHTGDVGSLDEQGFLTIARPLQGHDHLGRLEHLSARNRGSAAAPSRGGRMLRGRAAAPGMGRRGRRLYRLEERSLQLKSGELDALCLANIARFKRPREYRFVDALPKNNYGKVLKTELRKRL